MGPSFRRTTVMVASSAADPINDSPAWIYSRLPFAAAISFAIVNTGAASGVLMTFVIGSDTQLGPEFPVPVGGTAGVFPNQDGDFMQFLGAAGDKLTLLLRETAAATPSVMTVINLQPL